MNTSKIGSFLLKLGILVLILLSFQKESFSQTPARTIAINTVADSLPDNNTKAITPSKLRYTFYRLLDAVKDSMPILSMINLQKNLPGGIAGLDGAGKIPYSILPVETDPTVPAIVKGITGTLITNWNSAFAWGDHSTQGYLKRVNTDTIYSLLTHNHTLNNLSNVTITTPVNDQALVWNSTLGKWVNVTLPSPTGTVFTPGNLMGINSGLLNFGTGSMTQNVSINGASTYSWQMSNMYFLSLGTQDFELKNYPSGANPNWQFSPKNVFPNVDTKGWILKKNNVRMEWTNNIPGGATSLSSVYVDSTHTRIISKGGKIEIGGDSTGIGSFSDFSKNVYLYGYKNNGAQDSLLTTDSLGRLILVHKSTVGAGGGGIPSVFGRTGAVVAMANDYTWAQVDKTTSSLADLSLRSAGDLSSGTLADARLSANVALKNTNNNFSVVQNTVAPADGDSSTAAVTSGWVKRQSFGSGGSPQTFPQALSTGRTFIANDSVNNAGFNFNFKGALSSDSSIRVWPGAYNYTYSYWEPGIRFKGLDTTGFVMRAGNNLTYVSHGELVSSFYKEGDATYLQFYGVNRGMISSVSALVFNSNTSHYEFEGLGSSHLSVVGYGTGSSQGKTIIYETDPTLSTIPLGAMGRNGVGAFGIYDSLYRNLSYFDQFGKLRINDTTTLAGNANAAIVSLADGTTSGGDNLLMRDKLDPSNRWAFRVQQAYTNNDLTVLHNGLERAGWVNNGDMFVGLHFPTAKLSVKGNGSTSATNALNVQNNANTSIFKIRDDGQVSIPILSGSVTDMLTITAAGVVGRQAIPSGSGSVTASQGAELSTSDIRLGVAAGNNNNAFTTDRQINTGNRYLSLMGNKTNNGEFHLKFDDTLTSVSGTPAIKNWMTFRSPDKSFATQDFRMHSSVTKITGVDSLNHIFNMGFGFNAGGGALQTGRTGIGYSLESHYEPVVGTSYAEMHEWFINRAGAQIRFKSTTIDKATDNITTDYRTSTINFKNVAGTNWMAFQENSVVGNLTDFTAKSYNGRTAAFSKIAGDAGNSGLSITDAFNGNSLYINKTGGTDQALHVANGTSYFKDNIGIGTAALTGGFGNYATIGTTYPAIRFKHSTKDYFLGINDPSQTGLQFQNFNTSRSIFYFREDGDAIIGNNTTPDARLTIHAENAGSVNYALKVRDNASSELMAIRNDGLLTLPSLAGNILGKRNYDNSTNAGYNPIIFEPLSTDTRASRFYFKHNQTAQTGTFPNNVMKLGWNPDLVESNKKGLWIAMEGNYQTTPTDSLQEFHISSQGPTWSELRLMSYTLFNRNGLVGENQSTNMFSNLDLRAETINFLTTTNRSFGSISQNKTSRVTALTLQSGNGTAVQIAADSGQNLITFSQQFGPAPRVVDLFKDGNTRDLNMYNFRVTTNAGVEFQGYAGPQTDSGTNIELGSYASRFKRIYGAQIGSNRQIVGNLAAWGNHYLSGELIKYTPYVDDNNTFLRMTNAAGSATTLSILNNGVLSTPVSTASTGSFILPNSTLDMTSGTTGSLYMKDSTMYLRYGSVNLPFQYTKPVIGIEGISIRRSSAWNIADTIGYTLPSASVTYAKIQNVSANTFLANVTGSAATVQEVATNRIPLFGSAITGTPSSTTFLRGDGSWQTVAGGSGDMILAATQTVTGQKTFTTNDVLFSSVSPLISGTGALKFQDGNDGKNFSMTLNLRKLLFTAQQSSFAYQDMGYFMVDAPANAFSLWTTGTWRLNTTSTASNVISRKLFVNGSSGFNKDSVPLLSFNTVENVLVIDTTDGYQKRISAEDLGTSRTFSASLFNTTNVASSSISATTYYQRTGNVVRVWGTFTAAATTGSTVCELGISLPYSSSLSNVNELAGSGSSDAVSVKIIADATNDRATLRWTPPNTTSTEYSFDFTYTVFPL